MVRLDDKMKSGHVTPRKEYLTLLHYKISYARNISTRNSEMFIKITLRSKIVSLRSTQVSTRIIDGNASNEEYTSSKR